MSEKLYLGIDIGGTTSAVVLGDDRAEFHGRREFSTGFGPEGRERTLHQLTSAAAALAAGHRIEAVGISCGGPLDTARGLILCPPNLAGWENLPITEIFQEKLGAPAYLENDANAGALAEWRFGAGMGFQNLVFLTFGTGLGAGLILDGRLYRGASGLAGEVGHLRLAEDGPVGYHKRGSFEGFCSGPGLARLMAAELAAASGDAGAPDPARRHEDPRALSGRDVVNRARDGDPLALRVITMSGEYLGRGLAILIDTLNPELIVVGGMGVRLGDLLLEPARRLVEEEAIAVGAGACSIVSAALGERIGDFAALCVALEATAACGTDPA
jgi:glucokinase